MRLDRFVCKSTEFTRAEATQKINVGDVCVNGDTVTNEAVQVHESNTVVLDGLRLKAREFRYILMHKPANTICSNVDEFYPSVFNYLDIKNASELHVVGRLDADTTGLILITDDGRWSFNITVPSKKCQKIYRVELSYEIADGVEAKFKNGLKLQGEEQLTQPASLKIIGSKEVLLTITEGKFHQIKRMMAAVGNRVVSLHREAIGGVSLDVGLGQWRYLTRDEIQSFSK